MPSRVKYLQHDEEIYTCLEAIQGRYVPVCVGLVDVAVPYYYDGVPYHRAS